VFANIGSVIRLDIPSEGPFAPEAAPAVASFNHGVDAVASALAATERVADPYPISRQDVRGGEYRSDQRMSVAMISLVSGADRTTLHRASDEALAALNVDDDLLAELLA